VSPLLPQDIANQETLARYILSESWLYKNNRPGSQLRPNAFMPYRGELSVFRMDGLSAMQRAAIGEKLANEREQKHRQAELAAGRIYPEMYFSLPRQGRTNGS
jgi:hypothetical protein